MPNEESWWRADVLERRQALVRLQTLAEVLGGFCVEVVALEAADESRMDADKRMSKQRVLLMAADMHACRESAT